MSNKLYLTPKILFENPKFIHSVKSTEKGATRRDHLKEQLKHLRQYYRWLRDIKNIPAQDIEANMLAHFNSNKFKYLIPFAVYVEQKVDYVPVKQISRWSNIPFDHFKYLVHYAITNVTTKSGQLNAAAALVTAYLWYNIYGNKEITPPTAMYKTSDLDDRTFREYINKIPGVQLNYIRRGSKNRRTIRQYVTIDWQIDIEKGLKQAGIPAGKSSARIPDPPALPDDLINNFQLHQLYYPTTSEQYLAAGLPLVYSDGNNVNVPLFEGIAFLLLAYLIDSRELYSWLKVAGVKNPRYQIDRLISKADKLIAGLVGKFNYPSPRKLGVLADRRPIVGNHYIQQFEIMRKGLPVDVDILRKLKIKAKPGLTSQQNADRKQSLDRLRQNIIQSAISTGGWLRSIYSWGYLTERVFYKGTNPQGLPKDFRRAVIAPAGTSMLELDVVSNDISVLFNLSGDQIGLDLLKTGGDPYMHIAAKVFRKPGNGERDIVKCVVNPWLYGASTGTIASNNTLQDNTVLEVTAAIESEFAASYSWIHDLSKRVRNKQRIPGKYNPFGEDAIPMPKEFARTVAPSFIIQRVGVDLIRHAVDWQSQRNKAGIHIVQTIHDSIVYIVEDTEQPIAHVEVLESIRYAMGKVGLQALAVKAGSGKSLADADKEKSRTDLP